MTGAPEGTRRPVVAVIGNPNTGKSTLFGRLTGVRQRVGNYPGVTVEKKVGRADCAGTTVELVDLPGSYSLAAHSPDEMIAVDVLLGRIDEIGRPDAALVVVDAANLRRNLFLASQVLELGIPVVVALNMMDAAEAAGVRVDAGALGERIGARVVPTVAYRGKGLDPLRQALAAAVADEPGDGSGPGIFPQLHDAARQLAGELSRENQLIAPYEIERALLDAGAWAEQRLIDRTGDTTTARLAALRTELAGPRPLAAVDATQRYQWIAEQLAGVEERGEPKTTWSDHLDSVLTHRVAGTVIFIGLMVVVFQAVFVWAGPLMDLIDGIFGSLADSVRAGLGEGAFSSFVADGLIGGVGGVLIFLPQILILFLFIGILEDSGYMARAAFLMDRLMRSTGLSGQSFVPMLSSFACAIPGIMAARTIPDRRDRLTTILVAPLMSCSARLPVYVILIGAFVPEQYVLGGWVSVQGLVMVAMYLIGIVAAMLSAWLIKRLMLKGPTPAFLMELPTYRIPQLRTLGGRLWQRGMLFVTRAGTIILAVTIIVWAMMYFPRPAAIAEAHDAQRAAAEEQIADEDQLEERLGAIDNREAQAYLDQSIFGRMGHAVEPLFAPLGWDWRISMATLASFPAREVVVAVLGTTFSIGDEVDPDDDESAGRMHHALQTATRPDGSALFTLPVALSLMVFFALCAQCGATIATIKREANSWGWAIFAWAYMTALAYIAALLVYQIGSALL